MYALVFVVFLFLQASFIPVLRVYDYWQIYVVIKTRYTQVYLQDEVYFQEAVSTPIGAAADFDEDELEAELQELEGAELEEQLLQPIHSSPLPAPRVPAQPARAGRPTPEEDELAALQAEMAL